MRKFWCSNGTLLGQCCSGGVRGGTEKGNVREGSLQYWSIRVFFLQEERRSISFKIVCVNSHRV
jgi:hypothetical protein